ncbi:hypothetical protein DFJ73DRAFT_820677 [Zopfochytrium polystomum]|nr:hypothetical protein DFJ73DRAFT_820677 [Zopfochytrium polystomum]
MLECVPLRALAVTRPSLDPHLANFVEGRCRPTEISRIRPPVSTRCLHFCKRPFSQTPCHFHSPLTLCTALNNFPSRLLQCQLQLVAQWEALARMKNVVLYWTVVVAAVTHFVYAIGSAFITRDLARNPDFDSYYYKTMWFATLDLLCWFALIYHTCYRALLLTRSNMEGLWIVPTTVVAIQAVLQRFGLWFWYDNLSTNPSDTTPQNYWFGLGTLIFIPTVATGFFLLTQSAIIHTLPSGAPRCEVPPSQTAKMVCKTICAASTVVLEYITIRGYFFPATSGFFETFVSSLSLITGFPLCLHLAIRYHNSLVRVIRIMIKQCKY